MQITEVVEEGARATVSAVDWWTLGVAAVAALTSLGSIAFSIWALQRTHRHEDEAWRREQTFSVITRYFDAVHAFQSYLNNEVIIATVAGNFDEPTRREARRRQVVVQHETQTLFLVGHQDLLTAATAFQRWMDTGIEGFPCVGDQPVHLEEHSALIVSTRQGEHLYLELVNPVRTAIGRDPVELTSTPSANRYR